MHEVGGGEPPARAEGLSPRPSARGLRFFSAGDVFGVHVPPTPEARLASASSQPLPLLTSCAGASDPNWQYFRVTEVKPPPDAKGEDGLMLPLRVDPDSTEVVLQVMYGSR